MVNLIRRQVVRSTGFCTMEPCIIGMQLRPGSFVLQAGISLPMATGSNLFCLLIQMLAMDLGKAPLQGRNLKKKEQHPG